MFVLVHVVRRPAAQVAGLLGGQAVAQVAPQMVQALRSDDGILVRKLLSALTTALEAGTVDLKFALPTLRAIAESGPRMARSMAKSLAEAIE